MSTVFDLLKQHREVEDARRLLCHILGLNDAGYLSHKDDFVSPENERCFLEGIRKLKAHVPLQYITHTAPFFGRDFYVDESVLIPRFDTEIVLQEALNTCKSGTVLDLCTGSGCIGITMKLENPEYDVLCSDISEKALHVAKKNAEKLNAEVSFSKGDLFENIKERFYMIVSNPPYISEEEMKTLEPQVKDYEPLMALQSPDNGFYHIRRIAHEAKNHLFDGGWLMLEVGDTQGKKTAEILQNEGYRTVSLVYDLAGRERVVKGRK